MTAWGIFTDTTGQRTYVLLVSSISMVVGTTSRPSDFPRSSSLLTVSTGRRFMIGTVRYFRDRWPGFKPEVQAEVGLVTAVI